MRKKNSTLASAALVLVLSIAVLSSFVSTDRHNHVETAECVNPSDSECQGKHCSGTVGCSCSGFKPRTDGDVWQQAYCKNCGHHRKYHK